MDFTVLLWDIFWIYFVTGLFCPVDLLTSPCQQSLIDQCGRLITGFTPQKYLSGLVPDSAIRDDCEAFASVRLCNDKVLRPCLAAELVTLDPFIRQANEFIMLFCENDQFRRDYAHHGQCLAVVSSDINQCIANYGATVSDIAAISDNLAPQEVLHRSCCDGLHRLTACSFDAAVRKCHPSSADFVKKFLYKMMKSTLQDWIARQCFEYQTQCGREPALDEFGRVNIPPLANMTSLVQATSTEAETVTAVVESITTTRPAGKESGSGSSPTAPASVTNQPTGNGITELSADGTDNILAQSRPDPSALSGSPGSRPTVLAADDAAAVARAGVVVAGVGGLAPAAAAPTTPTESTGFYHHRPVNGKNLPERPAHSKARPRNLSADTHPLARKFLLIISTIAFLCGWY